MKHSKISTLFLGLIIAICLSTQVYADDFSDDMPIDEPIDDSVKLDINISFIIVKALSRARRNMDDVEKTDARHLSMGSIIVEPGAKVDDVTLIFDSDNNTQASK